MSQKVYTSEEFHLLLQTKLDESAESFAQKIRASNRQVKKHNPFAEYV